MPCQRPSSCTSVDLKIANIGEKKTIKKRYAILCVPYQRCQVARVSLKRRFMLKKRLLAKNANKSQ